MMLDRFDSFDKASLLYQRSRCFEQGSLPAMPVFISYNSNDGDFVDKLALNLVEKRHHVWLDRWELKVGDSLIDKIQEALKGSSAIIVVLSKHSVNSNWCRKELNAGLARELEENNSILLPCVIDDCEIPLFLKEKKYADFKSDPDRALSEVNQALDRISNPYQGRRSESPNFHTDWSVSWGDIDHNKDRRAIELTFVDHGTNIEYVILSQCEIVCNKVASNNMAAAIEKNRLDRYIRDVLSDIVSNLPSKALDFFIDTPIPERKIIKVNGHRGEQFAVNILCRRMGTDNGMSTLYHLDNNLKTAIQHMDEVGFRR